jgi:hypothetical protein
MQMKLSEYNPEEHDDLCVAYIDSAGNLRISDTGRTSDRRAWRYRAASGGRAQERLPLGA